MVYNFPNYLVAIPIALAVVTGSFGVLLCWKRGPWLAIVLCFSFSILSGGVIAPGLAADRVVIDNEVLEQTTGFWFAPTKKGFLLTEVLSISIQKKKDMKNRIHEVWVATTKTGQVVEIDPGDLWVWNGEDIATRLRARGIAVTR